MSGKYKKVRLSNTGTVHASRVAEPKGAVDSDDDSDNFQIAARKPGQEARRANVLDDDSDENPEGPSASVSNRGASSSKRSSRKKASKDDEEVIITPSRPLGDRSHIKYTTCCIDMHLTAACLSGESTRSCVFAKLPTPSSQWGCLSRSRRQHVVTNMRPGIGTRRSW